MRTCCVCWRPLLRLEGLVVCMRGGGTTRSMVIPTNVGRRVRCVRAWTHTRTHAHVVKGRVVVRCRLQLKSRGRPARRWRHDISTSSSSSSARMPLGGVAPAPPKPRRRHVAVRPAVGSPAAALLLLLPPSSAPLRARTPPLISPPTPRPTRITSRAPPEDRVVFVGGGIRGDEAMRVHAEDLRTEARLRRRRRDVSAVPVGGEFRTSQSGGVQPVGSVKGIRGRHQGLGGGREKAAA
jgi:hypothetical protein